MNLLIVDDERYIVNYLFALIEEHIEIDLNIQKAYSGSEALEILSISKIDLMLLDIHMPGQYFPKKILLHKMCQKTIFALRAVK